MSKFMDEHETKQVFGSPNTVTLDVPVVTSGSSRVNNINHFKAITTEMLNLYDIKNKDYGNSFAISLDEDGLLVAKIRLGDKYRRFSQLIKNPAEVKEESLRDTLIDMANYAVKTIMWMDDHSVSLEPHKNTGSEDTIDGYKPPYDTPGGIVCGHIFKEDDENKPSVKPYVLKELY